MVVTSSGGVYTIEAENLPYDGAWRVVEDGAASGGKYLVWEGLQPSANNNRAADGDIISILVEIPVSGTYFFKWLMRQPDEVDFDKANDSWLNFPSADRFGPVGSTHEYGTFIKVFGNAHDGAFKYRGRAEESNHDKSEIAVCDGW